MRPTHHALLSVAVGAAAWGISKEPLALPAAVAGGVLIDIDHLPDQVWYFYLRKRRAAFLVLHAWEWLAGLIAACVWLSFPAWLLALTAGYAGHLVTDQRFNHVRGKGYFISYRAYHAFNVDRVTPHWGLDPPLESLVEEWRVLRRLWRWPSEDRP